MLTRIAFIGVILLALFSSKPIISQSALLFDGDRLIQKLNQPVDDEFQQWLDFNLAIPDSKYPNELFGNGVYVYLSDGIIDGITLNNYYESKEYNPETKTSELKPFYRYKGQLPKGLYLDMMPRQVFDHLGMPHKEDYVNSPSDVGFYYYFGKYGIYFSYHVNVLKYIEIFKTSKQPPQPLTEEALQYPNYDHDFAGDPADKEIKPECYSGDCYNGYGEAWINASKQDVYKGNWQNGTVSGSGEYFKYDLLSYSGNWADGRKNGKGKERGLISRVHNGYIYEGTFSQDALHGEGTLFLPFGTRLVGTWNRNVFAGSGTYYFENSILDKYEGEILNHIPHGKGTLYYKDGTVETLEMINGWPVKWFANNEKIFDDGAFDLLSLDDLEVFSDDVDPMENNFAILEEADFCDVLIKILMMIPESFDGIKGEKITQGFGQTAYRPIVLFSDAVYTHNISGVNPTLYRVALAELKDQPTADLIFDQIKAKINTCIPQFDDVNISEADRKPESLLNPDHVPTKHYDIYSGNSVNEGNVVSLFVEPATVGSYYVTMICKAYH